MSSEPPFRPDDASPPPPHNLPPAPAPVPAQSSSSALPIVLIVGGIGCLVMVVVIGILIALLLPAVGAARNVARRMQSISNVQLISLAMLNHESAYGSFPPRAILDENGQALLSWRVAILPDLEEQMLYEEFHLDEPWDSPHNRPLADRMPAIFLSPGFENGDLTHYQLPVGEGTPFEGDQGLGIDDILDGMSNTILVVEADEGVIWTKPDDWAYDPSNPTDGVGNLRRGGFIAGFADGHVLFLQNDIGHDHLRAMITHDGGEEIPRDY